MYTLKNPTKTHSWFVDLNDHSQVENDLPLNSFNVRNDSNIIIYVELYGIKVGEVQRYSSDTFVGRDFEDFRLYNPDGNQFEINDIFVQMSKGQVMTSQPFNPQWDMMEDDLDKYSAGCNSRISLSATITLDIVKYWLNVQNDLIVQRRLSVAGTASMGTYEIDFAGDIISGNCGINATVLDIQKIRKTITESLYDHSSTDCTINGLMFDYKKNSNDISNDYTVVTGGTNPENAYDDDLSTYQIGSSLGGSYVTVFELSFSERTINSTNVKLGIYSNVYTLATGILQLKIDNVWTTLLTVTGYDVEISYHENNINPYDLVTGIRFQVKNSNAARISTLKIYDLSLFE